MTGTYAAKTDVPVSRSRDEIERTLARVGLRLLDQHGRPVRIATNHRDRDADTAADQIRWVGRDARDVVGITARLEER